ncbi:MAG: hypothetical protein O7E53_08540 [Alphaproteobacteria bacterium]|nr:hypothetical protein [Alphaproteobacteria bacterium]
MAALKAEMDGLVADFFCGDETAMDSAAALDNDRARHALLAEARLMREGQKEVGDEGLSSPMKMMTT